ncbi:transcriptional regulator, partial [Klebsiella pneumoniae]|nr:transcriptional regulator [Klebsiella pneumoniae]
MNNRHTDIASVSHAAETIAELRADHDFAVEY